MWIIFKNWRFVTQNVNQLNVDKFYYPERESNFKKLMFCYPECESTYSLNKMEQSITELTKPS
jgi:hypothetical protein